MSQPKRFVYILKSINQPTEHYVGLTSDPVGRLRGHNAGLSPHTALHRPWRFLVIIEFDEEAPARQFERYLKTRSGREFARRHFRQLSANAPGEQEFRAARVRVLWLYVLSLDPVIFFARCDFERRAAVLASISDRAETSRHTSRRSRANSASID